MRHTRILLCGPIALVFLGSVSTTFAEPIRFGRDVLPVLSANCFACHGPDEKERQVNLRLDLESEAKAERKSGRTIVNGQPEQSVIMARLTSSDPDVVMPPPSSRKKVSPEQIEAIRQWIAEGAKWERHWSFEPIEKPQGTLDDQVQRELQKRNLKLREKAAPQTLSRRLSLDLIGLPVTPEIADKFAADPSPAAYERLVDDLLQQSQFGEHWARMWLDLARYADTKGYEKDLGRTMWPYRDWVIQAMNSDLPLDQFTIDQLAGDLVPNPTQQQLVATAFHRNTMANDEGGTDDEEFRVAAVKDRVDTTIQVWMGLTMGCAKCHSHKYDPISNTEYYRFYAIFNQTEDADRYDDAPRIEIPNPEQKSQREQLQTQVTKLDAALKEAETSATATDRPDDAAWKTPKVLDAKSLGAATLTTQPDGSVLVTGRSEVEDTYTLTLSLPPGRYTALRLEALSAKLADGQFGVGRNPDDPNFVVSEFIVERLLSEKNVPLMLVNSRADFSQENWPISAAADGKLTTGWAISPQLREPHAAIFEFAQPFKLDEDAAYRISIVQNYGNRLTLARFRISVTGEDPKSLKLPTPSPEISRLRYEHATALKSLNQLNQEIAQLPILRELPADKRRTTKIQKRGNFLDLGDAVQPALLSAFGDTHVESPTRLDAARWLVSRENPLTPRVWANRIWSRLFGQGIVETEEDFGALGSLPSNPALLEWLAAEYRDGGWSLKKLLKSIVLSETYQQSSRVTGDLRQADPRNVYQSRGARYRLGAEVIRDQALSVSGLISSKIGGPSVMPPQPAGLWRSTYNGKAWIDAEGEDRFRRSLYTYLKRTTPYPSFVTFDGGSGEVCQIRRIRTNTPLQALVTLNDPVYLEAAAALARRMMTEAADSDSRAARGLRLALVRTLEKGESTPLTKLYEDAKRTFTTSPQQARALITACRGEIKDQQPIELAAWIVTANAILNLDEFLTRN